MVDISVIIVNYNTKDITRQCIDSIFKYTNNVSFEVIVVDNNSQKDDSVKVLSQDCRIKFIQSKKNLGFGKANNLGYKHAEGTYVLLLNSDTYLQNNALKFFVDEFDKLSEDVACVGSQLLDPNGNFNHSYGDLPSMKWAIKSICNIYLAPFGISFKKKSNNENLKKEPFQVPYVMGADICIRREVIEKYGMFDPDFFMYYEESEMQHRWRDLGLKAMIIPGPQIVHLECASTISSSKRKYTYQNRKMFLQGQFLYFKKIYSYPIYLLYRFINLFSLPVYLLSRNYSLKEKFKLIGRFLSSTRLSL